jgi:hypothetical protein
MSAMELRARVRRKIPYEVEIGNSVRHAYARTAIVGLLRFGILY